MKKYFENKNATTMPWVESPFFYELLENSDMNKEEKTLCTDFHEKGYVIIDLNLEQSQIDSIVKDMYSSLNNDETVFHADHFQYTKKKRIFELWKQSKASAEMCVNKKVLQTLKLLYNKEPFPFSTINFFAGSNQPLHSDVIHFHTVPSRWMVGVWVALEDVDETNGSLKIIPGSHKWNLWEYEDLDFPHPDDIDNGEEVVYRDYEEFLRQLCAAKKSEPYIARLKKGQALIWAANLLHGGCNIPGVTNFEKSRLVQVQHYFFEGCKKYYHPMYSRKFTASYASKWCTEENNIKTYLENGQVDVFGRTIKKQEP